jgi:hypothetical protein
LAVAGHSRPTGALSRLARSRFVPRYFFHLYNDEISLDEEGLELADLDAARASAIDAARDLACGSIQRGRINLEDHIDVHDESGEKVLTISYRQAFTILG